MEKYWNAKAAQLKAAVAHKGENFLHSASLEDIKKEAGNEFAALPQNVKASLVAVAIGEGRGEK